MRYALLTIILSLPVFAEDLPDLAQRMKDAEEMLRQDRHDILVQAKLRMIESNLDRMISEAEKKEKQDQQQQQKQQQQKQQMAQAPSKQRQSSQSPLQNSSLSETPPGPTQETAKISGTGSKWAKLPPAARDELLQTYAQEVPIKWRKRLEAYFLSVAAEEARK